jgi:hypothetical protein
MVMADIRNLTSAGRPFPTDAPVFRRSEPTPPGNSFRRFIVASAIASIRRTTPAQVATEIWPGDHEVLDLIERAASAPAMTTVPGWAKELAPQRVTAALEALAPASAAIQIIQRGLVLDWDGAGQIAAPGFVAGAGNASFVAEGAPIPVRQLASTAALLNPHKLAAIAALTRELIESSNAEAAVEDALIKAMGAAMDVAFFDANAEDATRSAGLKNGIAALTPSAATDGFEQVFEDIATLINAIATVGGSGPYIIVASPGRAIGIGLRLNKPELPIIFGTPAMGNDVAAIAPGALVAAAAPTAEVETANAGTLVMDTAPGPAGTMGTEKSMFQTNSIAIKTRWPVSWVLRDPRGFAWLTPTWK